MGCEISESTQGLASIGIDSAVRSARYGSIVIHAEAVEAPLPHRERMRVFEELSSGHLVS